MYASKYTLNKLKILDSSFSATHNITIPYNQP